jgi:hypothetical protein
MFLPGDTPRPGISNATSDPRRNCAVSGSLKKYPGAWQSLALSESDQVFAPSDLRAGGASRRQKGSAGANPGPGTVKNAVPAALGLKDPTSRQFSGATANITSPWRPGASSRLLMSISFGIELAENTVFYRHTRLLVADNNDGHRAGGSLSPRERTSWSAAGATGSREPLRERTDMR